jgi:dimeric dUTPase (all-alpha-NTP-PPase superfamily)
MLTNEAMALSGDPDSMTCPYDFTPKSFPRQSIAPNIDHQFLQVFQKIFTINNNSKS